MERSEIEELLYASSCKIRPNGDVIKQYDGSWTLIMNMYRDQISAQGSAFSYDSIYDIILPLSKDESLKLTLNDGRSLTLMVKTFVFAPKTMPKTDSALADLFKDIYPDYKERMYYDEMTECEMVDASLFDNTVKFGTYKLFDDTLEYLYYADIERRLDSLGCSGTFPSSQIKYRILLTKIKETSRNFFKEWVLSKPWDGVPRVDTWFKNVFGGSAPALRENKLEDVYLAKVARAWFVGGIKRMFKATQCDIIPVLISAKQGMGKTTGLEYTAGDPKWYAASTIDVTKAGGTREFLDLARGKSVIELAEGTTLRTNDQDTLKAFISKPSDQYRKPYAKREGLYPRHFILASTSNEEELLSDPTGNRRYFPIYIFNMPDFGYRTQTNVQQVWAEAYEMNKCGEEHFINAAWKPAVMMQEYAQKEDEAAARINQWLDDPMNGFAKVGAKVCERDIMENIFHYDKSHVSTELKHKLAWKSWVKGHGDAWAKLPYPYTRDGSTARGYIRERRPIAKVEEYNAPMTDEQRIELIREAHMTIPKVSEALYVDKENGSLRDQFIRFCRDNGLVNEWQRVPVDGTMNYEQLTAWHAMGWITYDKEDKSYHLTVAVN